MKPRVLILIEHYLPGFKAGGPTRSLANMVELLSDDYRLFIVTRDRDFGDALPYKNTQAGKWLKRRKAHLVYCTNRWFAFPLSIVKLRQVNPDIVYLNSVFCVSTIFVLAAIKLSVSPSVRRVIVAPRGEFAVSALKIGSVKKAVYCRACKLCGLFDRVIWQASSSQERIDILHAVGESANISVVSNVPDTRLARLGNPPHIKSKSPGHVDLICIARISQMKNHAFLIDLLGSIDTPGTVSLKLYGPIENQEIWARLQRSIAQLPKHVRVSCHGNLPPENVLAANQSAHFHILPTLGENFGHSIFEALAAGRPVLISDNTPWTEKIHTYSAGWAISLHSVEQWRAAMSVCIGMDQAAYDKCVDGASSLAASYANIEKLRKSHKELFDTGIFQSV